MAAHENLNNYQFRFRPTGPQKDYWGPDGRYSHDFDEDDDYSLYDYSVQAVHKPSNRYVGELLYHTDGPLFMLNVSEKHRRKGIAEAMVKMAGDLSRASNNRFPFPHRAYSELRPDGYEFGEAMEKKGYLRPNE